MATIIGRHNLEQLESKRVPLWYHKLGLSPTASGYGRKLATQTMVRLPGCKRWRRVYCCIFSNIGTCYVTVTGSKNWIVINGWVS